MGNIAAIPKCFYCQEDKNEILIAESLRTDMSVYHMKVCDIVPCANCEALMGRGVILITVDGAKSEDGWYQPRYYNKRRSSDPDVLIPPNPYRTGGWFVVSDDFVARAFDTISEQVLRYRWSFIEHAAAEHLGLFAESERMNKEKEKNA